MKVLHRPLLALAALLLAALACNMPAAGGGQTTPELPAANQTLTALFAITPEITPTFTLRPIITATSAEQAGGGQATTAPTATQAAQAATATTAPSVTQPPAASATIPVSRPRSPVVAKYLNTPPTLDGDWAEWKDLTTEYPATNVVYGSSNWSNENDLAGSFHAGWDNNNFYIAVKVRDDKYVQNATGENIYKGDLVEILMDTKLQEDYYYSQLSPDDFQLGLSPGRPDVNGAREAYLWFPSSVSGGKSSVKIAAISSDGVWRLEAAIPWSVFEVSPSNGMHLGFCLSVSDNDNTGENVQQSMVSNCGLRKLTDPTTWGDLLLSK